MKLSILKAIFSITLLIPFASEAQSTQCQTIIEGSINQVELRAIDGHVNCFIPDGANALQQITLLSKSIGAFEHKVRLLSVDQYGSATPISDHPSNMEGTSIASISPAGRRIAFGVWPTSATTSNKHLTVTYIQYQGRGAVAVDISDLPV